jgi:1-acyl-sn-glycerol-3-phosphate acyltransferase
LKPSARELRAALALLAPWRAFTRPVFHGLDRIPTTRPLLFVGNHTVWGVLDTPLLFAELWEKKGILLRALGDHVHFTVPVWGTLLRRFGVVDGTRENCARLMEAGESVLVFPGGGREVAKRRGEQYQLFWKERVGFARMALTHGATIVPFAALGVEDALHIVADANDLLASPLGPLVRRLVRRTDVIPPLVRPKRRPRLSFEFGEPIVPEGSGEDAVRALRDQTRKSVEHLLRGRS